ncbi:hypothetical protein G6F62_014992 [Rhizopus arrhizus]|nr:hypothetical protein G6F62_014992 [Rhizopus arrhizus]KAG1477525.1 hypothetical protein G6F54_014072 [Rhizopus delemar]
MRPASAAALPHCSTRGGRPRSAARRRPRRRSSAGRAVWYSPPTPPAGAPSRHAIPVCWTARSPVGPAAAAWAVAATPVPASAAAG